MAKKDSTEIDKKIAELIRVSSLNFNQVGSAILMALGSLPENKHHKIKHQIAANLIHQFMLTDKFLNQFVAKFKETFSAKQINDLLVWYQSDAMQIFIEKGKELLSPIYLNIPKITDDIVANLEAESA